MEFNACCELFKIIRHFFPDLIPLLRKVDDHRHQSYVTYESQVILLVRILAAVFHIGSMRKITVEFNHSNCIKNVALLVGKEDLEELPHWGTINDFLEGLDAAQLEGVIQKLVYRLVRMRSFDRSKVRGKYWQVVVDGTRLCSFRERHCPHCLRKEREDKDGNVVWAEYYHDVLEAKLVLHGRIVLSVATEFVENAGPGVPTQDCELNAFHRLAEKLKRRFPRLAVCLGMDSLYAGGPTFDLCRRHGWHFIIRFKDGSMPSVAEDFHSLKTIEPDQTFAKEESGVTKTYRYVTGISYQSHCLNLVEYTQSDRTYPFVFLTDLPVTRKNCERLVEDGRRRWKIENEGFNAQKNHGYGLKHLFSKDYGAMKNHYLLIQIGHMVAQMFANAFAIWKLCKVPDYEVFQIAKRSFKGAVLTAQDMAQLDQRRQYRFP